MDLDDLLRKGKQFSRKVSESAQGNLSQVGERSVRKAIEQAIGIAKTAVEEVKRSGLPRTGKVWVGAKVSITLVELSIQVEVKPDGDPSPAQVKLYSTDESGQRQERSLLF